MSLIARIIIQCDHFPVMKGFRWSYLLSDRIDELLDVLRFITKRKQYGDIHRSRAGIRLGIEVWSDDGGGIDESKEGR